jgi:hypothetical protein
MIFALLYALIDVVLGAVCFYLIDRFVRDRRLAGLLKILVALFVILAILRLLLPGLGI